MQDRIITAGWDAEQKHVVAYGFDVRGGTSRDVYAFTDADTLKLTSRGVSADGATEKGSATVKQIDRDTFNLILGDEQNPVVMTFKRKK